MLYGVARWIEPPLVLLHKESQVLVLSRKVGEKVMIGDNIVLVIKKITGKRVTMGIEAPRETSVHRNEVYDKVLSTTSEDVSDDLPIG